MAEPKMLFLLCPGSFFIKQFLYEFTGSPVVGISEKMIAAGKSDSSPVSADSEESSGTLLYSSGKKFLLPKIRHVQVHWAYPGDTTG